MNGFLKRIGVHLGMGCIVASLVGCTSVHSTSLETVDGFTWMKQKAKGIPTTLRVPSQIKIVIKGTTWLDADTGLSKPLINNHGKPMVTAVDHEIIYDDKIFLVDPKRPAAGTLKLGLTFSDRGGITGYNSDIDDQLVEVLASELNSALSTIIGGFLPGGGDGAGESAQDITGNKLIDIILASAVFDVDDPMLEHNIMEFLNSVINGHPPIVHSAIVDTSDPMHVPPPVIRVHPDSNPKMVH